MAVGFPYGHQAGLRLLYGEPVALSEEERAAIDALTAEQERLIAEHEADEELPEAVDDRLGEIEAALEELGDRPLPIGVTERVSGAPVECLRLLADAGVIELW